MNDEDQRQPATASHEYGAWRDDGRTVAESNGWVTRGQCEAANPSAGDRSRLLQLLGSINYKVLKRNRVYFEVDGVVYKTLWGLYWRSVFTGVEHFLLRCQPISGVWSEECTAVDMIDLPITRTQEGWAARGQLINFMLNRE